MLNHAGNISPAGNSYVTQENANNRCPPGAVCIIKGIQFYSEKKSFAFGDNPTYYRKSL